MPPKKSAATKAAGAAPRRSTRQIEATSASSRPKRAAASAPSAAEEPKSKRSKAASKKNAKEDTPESETAPAPKRRGRPPKASSAEEAPPAPAKKRPGRPKKVPTKEPEEEEQKDEAPPKRKGRPAKESSAAAAGPSAPKATSSRRGRSAQDPKDLPLGERTQQAEATEQLETELEQAIEEEAAPAPKPRGRPPKAKTEAAAVPKDTSTTTGKKRGRAAVKDTKTGEETEDEEPSTPVKRAKKSTATTKAEATKADSVQKRGPKKAAQEEDNEVEADTVEMTDEFGRHLWLMKAEPESRIEKGVDVKFSIDDLKACTKPEPWSGVRNPVARNNMQSMKLGDLAFFYHSNCKAPGIAGIMEIVREATADESAFDKADPYYDEKSDRSKPKWFCVHVEFRQKVPEYLGLAELKEHKDGKLKNMELLKHSRLSVSKVSKAEWDFIMELCGAAPAPPSNGEPTTLGKPVAKKATAAGPSTKTKKPISTDSKRKGPRASSLGPALQTTAQTSNRASSAQPAFPPAQATVLASVTEDEISGTVPPAFVLRSSPPAPQAIAEETNDQSAANTGDVEPLQNGTSNPTEDLKESTWLAGIGETVQTLTGDQGVGTPQAVAGAEQDLTMMDDTAPIVPNLSLEATPVEEAMKKVQSDMETSIMT